MSPDGVAMAEAERIAARERLDATVLLIKARVAPKAIARRTTDRAKAHLVDGGERAVDAVSERPILYSGIAAAALAAMTFWGLRRRRRGPDPDTLVSTGAFTEPTTDFGRPPMLTQTLKERSS